MTDKCPTCRGLLIGGTHVIRVGDDWAPRAAPRCAAVNARTVPTEPGATK